MPTRKKIDLPFRKILIANRGEIACRVIRTCQRMGIKTVAVYSEADAPALHVQQADEAVLIGPPAAAESYLNIQAIIQAARDTGTEAIHPGYGFLSENPDFTKACQATGITFIGPSPGNMELMGNKIRARQVAQDAGLPLIPGTETAVSDQEAIDIAPGIGFPLMVKAAAGGGGIGIRLVATLDSLSEALTRARSQAESSFGSGQVYLEKYLEQPSHVEVQVLADQHGNAVHLFERDCSVQRRNQKIVEETPCPKLTKSKLNAMYEAALMLVSHIGYVNAGTVEFLVDHSGDFYFLEMNTRLQVEHPITEMVTGLDLVEHQIRIAAGQLLPFTQKDVSRKGHAIEARLYSEDPETLMPASGRVTVLQVPNGKNIRVDGALFQGYEATPYYDPMMAKVIAWGRSRKKAIERLNDALDSFTIEGVTHNIPLIQQVLANQEFKDGSYSTHLLAHMSDDQSADASRQEERETVAAVTTALGTIFGGTPQQRSSPWRTHGRAAQMMAWPTRGGRW
jgi:acetyl-CoA carboxylase biotin carboxylase subunit